MSNERLLFQAADAAVAATALARGLWDGGKLTMREVDRLAAEARRLHCAATTLQQRVHGEKEPKIGD